MADATGDPKAAEHAGDAPGEDARAPSRWTRLGADWVLGRLGWCVGLSAVQAAELIGVDRSAMYARIHAEGWTRAASDEELLAMMRSVALAAAIRDMLEGRSERVAARAKEVEAINRIARTPPKRRTKPDAAKPCAEDAPPTDDADPSTGEAAHDAGAHTGRTAAGGGYDQRIRDAILGRLERIGIRVAETGAGMPADGGRQHGDAACEMAPAARAGPGADAA